MSEYLKTFETAMLKNRRLLLEMFQAVIDVYYQMFTMIETNDTIMATNIISNDVSINHLEMDINEHVSLFFMKQCPLAKDLRALLASIKVSNDLERLADYAVNVSGYIKKSTQDTSMYRKLFMKYKKPLITMLTLAREAYENHETQKAFDICDIDDHIDDVYQKHVEEFITIAKTTTNLSAEEASRALLIIKQMERAGDHLTNIAEHLIYYMTGKQITLN